MIKTFEFKVDVARNLGKKHYRDYIANAGLLRSRLERNGQVIEEERRGYTIQELIDYYVDEYNERAGWLKERPTIYGGNLNAEGIFLEHVANLRHAGRIYVNGTLNSFISGDFGCLYRALTLYLRCGYAGEVHQARRLGQSFPHPAGTDHGRYLNEVIACFALRRPDYAKRFFPRGSGLITGSHVTINRTGSLITALLHDEPEWQDKALNDARKFLQGKRQVTDRACVAYLVALYDGDPAAMSENLQILMDNYRKGWLVMGAACRLPLHGLYQMANMYLPENVFQRVRRPEGPGWWNEYADLVLRDPRPAELDQPYFVFPEPLGFMNEAVKAIDQ